MYDLSRQFNGGFFQPLSLSFLSGKYFFLEPNILRATVYKIIFQGEYKLDYELGFEAIR